MSVWCEEQTCIMAQLMPLLLAVSCFSKIRTGFTFLVPAHPGGPGKRAVKRVRACVRACVCVCTLTSSDFFLLSVMTFPHWSVALAAAVLALVLCSSSAVWLTIATTATLRFTRSA